MADDELTSEDIDEFLAKTDNLYDERDVGRETWPCPFCSDVFDTEAALGSHLEGEHGAEDDHIDEVVREVKEQMGILPEREDPPS
ncbi:MAG: hypothetical protein SVU88_03555, partial [Candidatus Nanohaloarchaea archaeon]|nr:hypothetical protein [Candidatus Nanohaloarchaea archaeon]